MKKIIFVFTLALLMLSSTFVFGEKLATLTEILNPGFITADQNRIFIADRESVSIYSIKDCKLIKKFGQKGEGPNEFITNPMLGSLYLEILPDSLVVNSRGKITFFTVEGEFQKEVKSGAMATHFVPMGSDFIGASITKQENVMYIAINLHNEKMETSNEITRIKMNAQPGKKMNPTETRGPLFYAVDGKIFVDMPNGTIEVFEKSGKKLHSITPNYDNVKCSEADQDRYLNFFKTSPSTKDYFEQIKQQLEFPKYFPPIRYYHIVDKKIYILSFKTKENRKQFLILNLEGKLLKKIMLPLDEQSPIKPNPYTFKNNKMYSMVENNDETWELHAVEVE